MNFSNLNDHELLHRLDLKVKIEKQTTLEILHLLAEVETRRLYLARGKPSLIKFCMDRYKYSNTSAGRRISAMRLLKQIPEIDQKLKEDKVNLSTLVQLHTHIRREEKYMRLKPQAKRELLSKIEDKSQWEAERALLKVASHPELARERIKQITHEYTEVTVIADEKLLQELEEIRCLLGNKYPNLSLSELVQVMAKITLEKLRPKPLTEKAVQKSVPQPAQNSAPKPTHSSAQASVQNAAQTPVRNMAPTTAQNTAPISTPTKKNQLAAAPAAGVSRYVRAEIERRIWSRDVDGCQFVDPTTGHKCQSKFALQIDHIKPFAHGGPTTEDNLRLLCRVHNLFRAGPAAAKFRRPAAEAPPPNQLKIF